MNLNLVQAIESMHPWEPITVHTSKLGKSYKNTQGLEDLNRYLQDLDANVCNDNTSYAPYFRSLQDGKCALHLHSLKLFYTEACRELLAENCPWLHGITQENLGGGSGSKCKKIFKIYVCKKDERRRNIQVRCTCTTKHTVPIGLFLSLFSTHCRANPSIYGAKLGLLTWEAFAIFFDTLDKAIAEKHERNLKKVRVKKNLASMGFVNISTMQPYKCRQDREAEEIEYLEALCKKIKEHPSYAMLTKEEAPDGSDI